MSRQWLPPTLMYHATVTHMPCKIHSFKVDLEPLILCKQSPDLIVGGIFPETMTTVHKNIHCPSSSLLSSLSGSFPHWLANILKPAFPCSQWPSRHGPVTGPPPESSPSSPVVIDQTTQPLSGSSSDDSTLRTTATMRPTWPNPTFTLGTNEFVIGAASFHSVCTWTLLLLTVVAISGSLWAQWQNYKYSNITCPLREPIHTVPSHY